MTVNSAECCIKPQAFVPATGYTVAGTTPTNPYYLTN